jgi:hypothetical protein
MNQEAIKTPEERAYELLDKFMRKISHLHKYSICLESAKECALIAVYEILEVLYSLKLGNALEEEIQYYEEVKQELKKLC